MFISSPKGIFQFVLFIFFAGILPEGEVRAAEALPPALVDRQASSNEQMTAPAVSREWRISPQFAISFPQPLQVGVEIGRASLPELRGFADLGYLRLPISGGEKNFRAFSTQLGIRFFPGDRWYFLLLSLGYRYLGAAAEMSAFKIEDQVVANQGTLAFHTLFTRFAVGADFHLSPRLLLGFDLGYQFALLGAAKMELSDSQSGQTSSNSDTLYVDSSPMRRISKLGLPQLTLLRLTWQMD
jgi:hypothetical protein